MNDIEKDLLNFIRNKEIDFFRTEYTISITFDNYAFELTAELFYKNPDKYGNCDLLITCTLLKDFYKFIELSEDFKSNIANWFSININYKEEQLMYLMGLNNYLMINGIKYSA